MRKQLRVLGLGMAATILVAACSGSTATQAPASAAPASEAPASSGASEAPASASPAAEAAKVRLQLQWTPQAQFAGYFAADKQGYFAEERPRGRDPRRRPDDRPAAGRLGAGRARVHDLVGPEGPRGPRGGLRPRRHRPDLPALRHAVGRRGRTAAPPTSASAAGKKVGAWDFGNEFEVTAGLALNCGLTPGLENNGDPATQYQKVTQAVRHGRVPEQGDRPRRGDDLQRVRAGARGDEPGHGRAVQARGPQRLQLERLPELDAPGRDLRPRGVAQRGGQP